MGMLVLWGGLATPHHFEAKENGSGEFACMMGFSGNAKFTGQAGH